LFKKSLINPSYPGISNKKIITKIICWLRWEWDNRRDQR